jgi:hypothetical protein
MPSKKKARDKARRSAKIEKEEKKQVAVACNGVAEREKQRGESLEKRLERMQLEDLTRHNDETDSCKCLHSLASLPDGYLVCGEFVDEFVREATIACTHWNRCPTGMYFAESLWTNL